MSSFGIPTSGFEPAESSEKLEEERLWGSEPSDYYPVKLGDIYNNRYKVRGKLGYGGSSTIWLASDIKENRFVVLKVFALSRRGAKREPNFFSTLDEVEKTYKIEGPGGVYIRRPLDQFSITWNDPGKPPQIGTRKWTHPVLVFKPLGPSIGTLFRQRLITDQRGMTPEDVKLIIRHTLSVLDYLHTANFIHGEVHEDNLLLPFSYTGIPGFVLDEGDNPTRSKVIDKIRTVYESHSTQIASDVLPPTLCGFSNALSVSKNAKIPAVQFTGEEHSWSPQVILGIPWGKKNDIWQLGCMTWYLFEGHRLFHEGTVIGWKPSELCSRQLALMIAVLGKPSIEYLKKGQRTKDYFDSDWKWTGYRESDDGMPASATNSHKIPKTSLKAQARRLSKGTKRKEVYLDFIQKCLQWEEKDRWSAKQLLGHPWLE
ncbi:kinase-like protein [Rhizodiscina lignyota]|uniref:non-specific serine/threonine protein kinase n=1 Tax=Rhizodiscina lignyota TaxID=1504668 RepID=A0A9P4M6L3_9PEZI|nr:kinase-like protein [Rhizodiscina lignyota]